MGHTDSDLEALGPLLALRSLLGQQSDYLLLIWALVVCCTQTRRAVLAAQEPSVDLALRILDGAQFRRGSRWGFSTAAFSA